MVQSFISKDKFMVREEQMNHPWPALFCRVALAQHEVFTQTLSAHRPCLSTHAHTCSLMQTINNAHTQKRNLVHKQVMVQAHKRICRTGTFIRFFK